MTTLTDRIVLITGGGSGVGLATAKGFLAVGAKVVITGRNPAKLQQAAEALQAGDRLLVQAMDVSNLHSVQHAMEFITGQWGAVQTLVNNAGMNVKERMMRELTPEAWQRMIATNLNGAFYCIHAVLPSMLEHKDGVIININSVSGKRAMPLAGTAYSASKFGMAALGIGLGAEERENGIRVTNIYPGEIDTAILDARPKPLTQEQRQQILKPEDVANAVLFVACLPAHVSIPELIIKPANAMYV